MGPRLYLYGAVLAIVAALAGLFWWQHHTIALQKETIALQKTALTAANTQTEAANENTKTLANKLQEQAAATEHLHKQMAAARRDAAEKERQLNQLLAAQPSAASAAAITGQLRADLESIQRHPFDGAGAEAYATPPGAGAYYLDARSTAALAKLARECSTWMHQVDP